MFFSPVEGAPDVARSLAARRGWRQRRRGGAERGGAADARRVPSSTAQIDLALSHDPDDATALYVSSCLDIENGDLEEAATRTARLATTPTGSDYARVLAVLIRLRRVNAREPLREALVEAWKRAGRPDLGALPLPGLADLGESLDAFPVLTEEREALLTPGEKLLFLWGQADKSKRLDLAIAAAAQPRQNPLVVNLEVLSELASLALFYSARAASAEDAARRVGKATVESDPGNGDFRLAAWLATGSSNEPFTRDDMDLLEDALARPRFEIPRTELLEELRALAHRWAPEHAGVWGAAASMGLGNAAALLWHRSDVTNWGSPPSAAVRSRASKVLLGMGEPTVSLANDPRLHDRERPRIEGCQAERRPGYRIRRSEPLGSVPGLASRGDCPAQKRLGTWPFAARWREWTP